MCRLSATLSMDVLWLGRTCLKTRNANRNVSIGTRDRRIAAPAGPTARQRGRAVTRRRAAEPTSETGRRGALVTSYRLDRPEAAGTAFKRALSYGHAHGARTAERLTWSLDCNGIRGYEPA